MKIVLATPMYPPEIAEPAPYVKELARRISKDHEVSVVAYASTSEYIHGVALFTVSKRNPLPIRFIKYIHTLYNASKGADIIYTQGGIVSGIPAVITGHFLKIPVVFRRVEDEPWKRAILKHLTGQSPAEFRSTHQENLLIRLFLQLEKWILNNANYIITPSIHQKNLISNAYNISDEKIVVIYNPVEKEEKLPFAQIVALHQIVISSNLASWSRIDTVIKSIALLKKEFPDIKLIVEGVGAEKENLVALAEELSVSKNVTFVGHVSKAEAWHLRKTSHLYVENSLEDISLDKILWSLSAGIPVVAGNTNGAGEILTPMKTGLLFKSGDSENLAQMIQKLFNNDDLRSSVIQNGQESIVKNFSWEAHTKALNSIFESALKF